MQAIQSNIHIAEITPAKSPNDFATGGEEQRLEVVIDEMSQAIPISWVIDDSICKMHSPTHQSASNNQGSQVDGLQ